MNPAAVAATLLLAACSPDETVSGQVAPDDVFVLSLMDGQPVAARITIRFPQKGRMAGQAPCNRYFAQQTAPLPWFEPGPIGATRRACSDLPLEQRYLNALAQMTLAETQGDVLILSGGADRRLEYRRE